MLKSECLFIGKCCVVWFLLEAKILKKEKNWETNWIFPVCNLI